MELGEVGHQGGFWEGRERKVWEVMESNMETYITMCKIDNQWEFAV